MAFNPVKMFFNPSVNRGLDRTMIKIFKGSGIKVPKCRTFSSVLKRLDSPPGTRVYQMPNGDILNIFQEIQYKGRHRTIIQRITNAVNPKGVAEINIDSYGMKNFRAIIHKDFIKKGKDGIEISKPKIYRWSMRSKINKKYLDILERRQRIMTSFEKEMKEKIAARKKFESERYAFIDSVFGQKRNS